MLSARVLGPRSLLWGTVFAAVASFAGATEAQTLLPPGFASKLGPEQLERAQAVGRLVTDEAQKALQSPQAESARDLVTQASRRADDISNAALAEERGRVMRLIGVDPEGEASLYYFVSWSMPIEILRSYVLEAMWSGGTLVFRGIPPGRDLKTFIVEDLQGLVYGKGATAALSIDPRLFDVYQVKVVPSIVLTTQRRNFECIGANPRSFAYEGRTLSYDMCPPADPDTYWKIAGALTSDYALRAFAGDGAVAAEGFLSALSTGLAFGEAAPKAQQPFRGEWKDAISPEEVLAVRRAVEAVRQTSSPAGSPGASSTPPVVMPGRSDR